MLDRLKRKKVSPSVLAIIILLLILICCFVLFFEVNNYRKIKSEKHDFYYYFNDSRIDFEANIILGPNSTVLSMENSSITFNSIPVYYNNSDSMIIPYNMEIVYPYKNSPMYKVGKFSNFYMRNNYLYMNAEAGNGRVYDCFLYDGNDIYVFLENTTVIIGNQNYNLSPMSYVEVNNNWIILYNYKTKEYISLDNDGSSVGAYTEEYAINLLDDTFTYGTSFYVLMKNVDGLSFVEL